MLTEDRQYSEKSHQKLIQKAKYWENRARELERRNKELILKEDSMTQNEIDGALIGALHAKLNILN